MVLAEDASLETSLPESTRFPMATTPNIDKLVYILSSFGVTPNGVSILTADNAFHIRSLNNLCRCNFAPIVKAYNSLINPFSSPALAQGLSIKDVLAIQSVQITIHLTCTFNKLFYHIHIADYYYHLLAQM